MPRSLPPWTRFSVQRRQGVDLGACVGGSAELAGNELSAPVCGADLRSAIARPQPQHLAQEDPGGTGFVYLFLRNEPNFSIRDKWFCSSVFTKRTHFSVASCRSRCRAIRTLDAVT